MNKNKKLKWGQTTPTDTYPVHYAKNGDELYYTISDGPADDEKEHPGKDKYLVADTSESLEELCQKNGMTRDEARLMHFEYFSSTDNSYAAALKKCRELCNADWKAKERRLEKAQDKTI